MAETVLTCVYCGSDIERPRGNRQYCSASCRARRSDAAARESGRYAEWTAAKNERNRRKPIATPCFVCGEVFTHRSLGRRFCSNVCSAKASYEARRNTAEFKAARARYRKNPGAVAHQRMRQAAKRTAVAEAFHPQEIFERDRFRCHMCKRKCDPRKVFPQPLAPTIDHLVPLACGGDHTRANVATACVTCNVRKQHRGGGEQLAVI